VEGTKERTLESHVASRGKNNQPNSCVANQERANNADRQLQQQIV
jgi:hypothetical protein